MRIAQVIDSLHMGGAEKMQETFAQVAIKRGYSVTVVVLSRASNTPLPERLRALGVRIVEFTGRNLVDPVRFIRLCNFFRRERFDVIHSHLAYSNILSTFAGLFHRTPLVITLHNVDPDDWEGLEALALRFGKSQILAVGGNVANAYRKKVPHKPISIVVNPVSAIDPVTEEVRKATRQQIASDLKRPLVISVGRLEAQKGFADLITSIDLVRKSYPNAFLAIAGIGKLHDELASQITKLGLQHHVRLLGMRSDIPVLLASSDIFVSSSHWEGMPIAILEAMAARLPVIATAVGDVPNVITSNTGILVDAHAPQQLAEAIRKLLGDEVTKHRLGEAGFQYVTEKHNADAWLDQLLEIYEGARQSERKIPVQGQVS